MRTILRDGVREPLADPQLDRAQTAGIEAARAQKECPFFAGVAKRVKFVSGVTKTVSHRLGREASFFPISDNEIGSGNAAKINRAATSAQAKLDPLNQIAMTADVDCVVTIWFYPRPSLEVV